LGSRKVRYPKKREVRCFAWVDYFKPLPDEFNVFCDHFSTVLSYSLRAKVPLGCNARKFVEWFSGIEELDEVKRRTVESLRTLQSADPKKKRLIEPQVFQEWVLPKMPDVDPFGRLLKKTTQREITEYCYAGHVTLDIERYNP
jgi:hypothetical protein